MKLEVQCAEFAVRVPVIAYSETDLRIPDLHARRLRAEGIILPAQGLLDGELVVVRGRGGSMRVERPPR